MLKKHNCPHCGSHNLESYKDESSLYIKCEDCGKTVKTHTLKKDSKQVAELKKAEGSMLKRIFPTFIGLLIFTILFALFARLIMARLGAVIP